METRVSSVAKEVIIGDKQPTMLTGEYINPAGKKRLAEALLVSSFSRLAHKQLHSTFRSVSD